MKKRVLVIEDDKYLMNAYRVKLTKVGFEVQTASDGDEGLAALPSFNPDVVLLDLVMPKRDGFSFLEEMKQMEKFQKVPVIITSNLGQKEDVDRGMKLGAVDYIVKSNVGIEDIVTAINKALTKLVTNP